MITSSPLKTEPVDIVLAMNFSYWLLLERELTIDYFKSVYIALVDDGIFFLDAYGGYEAFQELKKKPNIKISPTYGIKVDTTR